VSASTVRRRPDIHGPRHRVARLLPVLALVLGLLPLSAMAASAEAGTPTTYQDHAYATAAGAASADKPQSKLWYNDGSWWSIMTTTSSVKIFHLVDHVWRDTGTVVDTRIASTGDALWVDGADKLYVASRTAGTTEGLIRVLRFSYSATSGYTLDTGFPVKIAGGGSESVTIARDGAQRLWVTFTRSSAVWVAHSTTSDTAWTAPFRITNADTDVAADDISAVIALPGKIGVMWSDQASNAFRFALHNDEDPDTTWTTETPLEGTRIADDHMNLKSAVSGDGGVYAAIKTSLGDGGEPGTSASIMVLSRSSGGTWSSAVSAQVRDGLTRPQLALDSDSDTLFVMQSTEGGGKVYFKSTPLSSISFGSGPGTPLIEWPNARINNVSTTKDSINATTDLVAIATDQFAGRYYHAEMALGATPPGDTTPPTVTATTPTDGATGVSSGTSVTATFSEPMQAATITASTFTLTGPAGAVPATVTYDAPSNTATLKPTSPLAGTTVYTATVTTGAKDVAGNGLAAPHQWTFTTAAAPATETVTITPNADSYVVSTNAAKNFGTSTTLAVDGSPVTISYLKFDTGQYAGRAVQSATLRVRTTNVSGSGSTGKQNVKLVSNDSWTETGVTYQNKPALGTTVGTLGPTVVNKAYSVTLRADIVQGALDQTPLSLGLNSSSSNGVALTSRETATPPQLVLVLQAP
jgi:Bacterial Ig-like domain